MTPQHISDATNLVYSISLFIVQLITAAGVIFAALKQAKDGGKNDQLLKTMQERQDRHGAAISKLQTDTIPATAVLPTTITKG